MNKAWIGSKVDEGKTKIVFENRDDETTGIIRFKNDITAEDGRKREIIEGKAFLDARTNDNIFRLFNKAKLPTHYIELFSQDSYLVWKPDYIFPLEAISRRVGYGSICEIKGVEIGYHFKELFTEFRYKDDFLHDPKLDDDFIGVKDPDGYFATMKQLNMEAFIVLEEAFRRLGYQLVDFKLEYATINGKIYIIDEMTTGNIRVWPFKVENPDFSADNLLS